MKVMCIRTSKSYPNVILCEILDYVGEVTTPYYNNEDFFILENKYGTKMIIVNNYYYCYN